jgi:hypothetical protein
LAAVRPIFKPRVDTLDMLADPRRGTDYDGTRASGISDPTPAQAAQLERHHHRQQAIRDNLILLVHHSRMLYSLINGIESDFNSGELAAKHRCHVAGAEALEPWARPECTNVIGEQSVTKLCDACRQRRDEWRRKQRAIEGAA